MIQCLPVMYFWTFFETVSQTFRGLKLVRSSAPLASNLSLSKMQALQKQFDQVLTWSFMKRMFINTFMTKTMLVSSR